MRRCLIEEENPRMCVNLCLANDTGRCAPIVVLIQYSFSASMYSRISQVSSIIICFRSLLFVNVDCCFFYCCCSPRFSRVSKMNKSFWRVNKFQTPLLFISVRFNFWKKQSFRFAISIYIHTQTQRHHFSFSRKISQQKTSTKRKRRRMEENCTHSI